MSRFIAVVHCWHVDSKGFHVTELGQRDAAAAEAQAALLAMRRQGACCASDYTIVEIDDNERLLPRRLTWKERLTGFLDSRSSQEQTP